MKNPSGITYEAEYEPDREQMVKALQIIKDAPRKNLEDEKDELQEGA